MNAGNIPNDDRLKEFYAATRELGREAALGKDSLPKLALKVLQAAHEGIIDADTSKGNEPDDAARLYDEYAKACSAKEIHEHTDGGKKANVSKVRQLIKMGCSTTCDPIDVMTRAVTIRQKMHDDGDKPTPAYAGYVNVARTQNASDRDLTDEELKGCFVKNTKDKTVEAELESIMKKMDRLITGDAGVQDQSQELIDAHGLIKERIAAMILIREDADLDARLAARGLTVMRPVTSEVTGEVEELAA